MKTFQHEMGNVGNLAAIVFLLFSFCIVHDAAAKTKETSHYDVVAEYVRSLGTIYHLQQTAGREFGKDSNDSAKILVDGIRSSARFKLELEAAIEALKGMSLEKPFDTLIPTTIFWYQKKIELFNESSEISKKILEATIAGPKPGVDYAEMVTRLPEITASIEYADKSIFESMVLVFGLLVDKKPDSQGHMSHLIITKAQKKWLINEINISFGESLNKRNKSWTVMSAALLKSYLQKKGYKCKDEWQPRTQDTK